ncbi:MAG TPA: hypothetical protein VGN88_01825, partial [Phycisphaerae bacterium]
MPKSSPPELVSVKSSSSWIVPLALTCFCVAMAVFSRGFLEADEITHFLCARSMWSDPYQLVSIWGRLGCTAFFGLAAPFGVTAARLQAVAITVLTAQGTAVLLRHFVQNDPAIPLWIRKHSTALAWLLLFAQPCFILNCFTVMTEMLLACTWVWGVLMVLKFDGKRGLLLAGAVLGIGGLMRPEGWIAMAAWPIILALYLRKPGIPLWREWPTILLSTFISGIPVLIWFFLGAMIWHTWRWFIMIWPWAPKSQYGRSGQQFLLSILISLCVWMWVPVAIGFWQFLKRRDRHAIYWLILPAAGLFLLHGTLGSLGLFGSMSLPRYFVSVSPMLVVLAVRGLACLMPAGKKTAVALLLALSILPGTALACFQYLPMRTTVEQNRLDVVIQAVKDRQAAGAGADWNGLPPVVGHPYVQMQLQMPFDSPEQIRVPLRDKIMRAPVGTLLVVDSMMWKFEGRPTEDELRRWGYQEDAQTAAQVDAV